MPELPDVEGFRRYLARYACGRPIVGVEVIDRTMLRNASPQALGRALRGREFTEPVRRGKWLYADAGGPIVLMHFGMTGLLKVGHGPEDRHRHDRIAFSFADGELRYRNMRKLGGVWLAADRREREAITGKLGPDALDVSRAQLGELLAGRRGRAKPTLMDQTVIAGLGNLLVDEILWRICVNPKRPVAKLRSPDLDRMHTTMREVLRESNRHARVPGLEGWLTAVRDGRGAACPRCGTTLRKEQVGGRTACWCPRCQLR